MNHVMIDLETLGTEPSAAFISIGACVFTPETGVIGEKFQVNVDWTDALKTRSVSGDTLKWWLRQSYDARKSVLERGIPLKAALGQFRGWLPKSCVAWGNGSTFDISILEDAYRAAGEKAPWLFYNVRDVRTICDVASVYMSRDDVPFVGVKHDAMSDAIHQATYVSKMWQLLQGVVK